MHDGLGPVLFAAMWTAQTTPPHSVHEPQSDVTDNENTDAENGGVTVYDEQEVVDVDHSLGVPRASASELWIAVWTEPLCHKLYSGRHGINLPRK